MKVFVTGATGFLGRAFCQMAIASGHEVMGLCRTPDARLPADCRRVQGSLEEIPWPAIERFGPDAGLHLAWIATPGVYLNSCDNGILVEQSEALFRGLARRGATHLAGTGTCLEYAPSSSTLREADSPLSPGSPYARAKVQTCRHLQGLAREAKLSWSWFRVFYPYGEGEHPDRMPSALMRKLAAGETLELNTPDSVKDYIHVEDASRGMLAALEHRLVGAVNVGTGEGLRILDLAQAVARCWGSDPRQVSGAAGAAADPFPITVADATKLRATGWRPQIGMEEGLGRLRESLRQH